MWPLCPLSAPPSTIHTTLECQRVAAKLHFFRPLFTQKKKISFSYPSHKKMFFEMFFLSSTIWRFWRWSEKLGYKNMTAELRGSFKSSTELVDASSTWELFSFHAFEQIENAFTDKRGRCRVNGQQAARLRFALSLLAASCVLRSLSGVDAWRHTRVPHKDSLCTQSRRHGWRWK